MLALALVIVAGIGVTRLSRPSLRHPVLDGALATGVPFVLLGALLGPGLGVLDAAAMRLLKPVVALGIGWIGASFGARLEWRMLRRGSRRTWLVGATLAVPVLLTTAVVALILARLVPPLADAWGRPIFPVALVLAGAATTAASWRGPKLGRRNALLDTAFGAAVAAAGVALYHPQLAFRSIALTLVASGGLGGLVVLIARGQKERSDAGVAIEVFGVILWGAGFSYATGLSPFVVCALITAVIVSFSPPGVRHTVQHVLRSWEFPLYAAFLIIAGALLHRFTAWVLPAALSLAVVRAAVRWVTVRFGVDQVDPVWRSLPFAPPPEFAFPAMRQGAAAVALAAGFELVHGGSGAVLLTVLLSVLAAEALAARAARAPTPLTAAPPRAEVT